MKEDEKSQDFCICGKLDKSKPHLLVSMLRPMVLRSD